MLPSLKTEEMYHYHLNSIAKLHEKILRGTGQDLQWIPALDNGEQNLSRINKENYLCLVIFEIVFL